MAETILDLKNIRKRFRDKTVHEGLGFELKKGEILSLFGGSGTGKRFYNAIFNNAAGGCSNAYRHITARTHGGTGLDSLCTVSGWTYDRDDNCSINVDTSPLQSTDSRERVESVRAVRSLEAMASGTIRM